VTDCNAQQAKTPLPPLPTFTPAQWQALSRKEKDFYRDLKHQHRALASGEVKIHATPTPPQAVAGEGPFRDSAGGKFSLNIGKSGCCFLLLSGPSARTLDLTKLQQRGCFTVAINNAAALHRPQAWTFVDPPDKFHHSIWRDPGVLKFVQWRFRDRTLRVKRPDGKFEFMQIHDGGKQRLAKVDDMPGVILCDRNADFCPERWLPEQSLNWGNSKKSAMRNKFPTILNSMFMSVKLCYSLGFRVVYLLGCDFSMTAESRYAFAEQAKPEAVASNMNSYRQLNEFFGRLKPHFDSAGFRIFNCNPQSGFTVFPHLSYSEAVRSATAGIDQTMDTVGWYEK
jgi:hypothetical protein